MTDKDTDSKSNKYFSKELTLKDKTLGTLAITLVVFAEPICDLLYQILT